MINLSRMILPDSFLEFLLFAFLEFGLSILITLTFFVLVSLTHLRDAFLHVDLEISFFQHLAQY